MEENLGPQGDTSPYPDQSRRRFACPPGKASTRVERKLGNYEEAHPIAVPCNGPRATSA